MAAPIAATNSVASVPTLGRPLAFGLRPPGKLDRLVGHSLGASAAVSLADQLRKAGLRVALIVTLDPVLKTTVPDNVHLLKNFYLSSGVGKEVERGTSCHGMLQNVEMGRNAELGHVSLTTAPVIKKQIMRDIFSANFSCR